MERSGVFPSRVQHRLPGRSGGPREFAKQFVGEPEGEIWFFRDPRVGIFEIKGCVRAVHARKEHYHDEISVGLVEEGACAVSVPERDFSVSAGELVFFAPGTVHACRPMDTTAWRFLMLYLDAEFAFRAWGFSGPRGTGRAPGRRGENPEAALLFRILLDGTVEPVEKHRALKALLELVQVRGRSFGAAPSRQEPTVSLCRKVDEALKGSLDRNIPLKQLAENARTSSATVLRAFRNARGVTPHALQTIRRINRAKRLLVEDWDLATVAVETGFYDQSHFCQVFKTYCGVTPRRYRSSQ